jgi:hypothetical protein
MQQAGPLQVYDGDWREAVQADKTCPQGKPFSQPPGPGCDWKTINVVELLAAPSFGAFVAELLGADNKSTRIFHERRGDLDVDMSPVLPLADAPYCGIRSLSLTVKAPVLGKKPLRAQHRIALARDGLVLQSRQKIKLGFPVGTLKMEILHVFEPKDGHVLMTSYCVVPHGKNAEKCLKGMVKSAKDYAQVILDTQVPFNGATGSGG